ncbi:MAG: AAA family ATPase [Actinomycetota bacterium]|nr:AAA family ATPase [Actinomycetota bacterium]
MDEDVAEFARLFQGFMQQMTEVAWAERTSPVREVLDGHLEAGSSGLPVVSESFAPYDHANVQVALMAYLDVEGRSHATLGLSGQQRHFGSLADLLEIPHGVKIRPGAVDFVTLAVGPEETLPCVQFGLFTIRDRGTPLVVLMRGPEERHGLDSVVLEVLAAESGVAQGFLAEIRRLMVELNVFRGQVVSFGESHMGRMGAGPVVFHRRPDLGRDQLVLPDGVLESIERHVFGIAEHRDRLRASDLHVKRGLLLHGPPGTGKTHTVRYLISRVRDHTVLLLTGGGLHMVRQACALARMLQPAVVVLEDVDLVAQERGMFPGHHNPLLFDVLNEMDGIDEDADVAFLLTSNRADLLEPALAARPGRVDLAIEIELPDDDARRRLIELYGRGLDLRLTDGATVVVRTAGVTASFIKELMRKAGLLAAVESDGSGRLTVTDAHVQTALDELLAEGGALTRVLLGGGGEAPGRGPRPGTEWLLEGDASPE